MASAKRGSKKSSAKKTPAKKTAEKKSAAKKPAAKKTAAKKPAPAKTSAKRRIRSWSKRARGAAIGAATALAAVAGVAVARAVRRRIEWAAEAPAACTIAGRGDVARIVLTYIRGLGFPNASEGSNFTSDVPTTPSARRVWAGDLVTIVRQRGCRVGNGFGPDQCAGAEKVADIIDSLWKSVRSANGIEG